MTERAGFWNVIAKRYARTPVADEAAYQEKLRITQSHFDPDWEVLEFGCGTGSTAITHAPHVQHIHALDISPKMLEIARDKADAAGIGNITWEQAAFGTWEGQPDHYNAVLGMSILHLLNNPAAGAAKAFEVLKPGGLFVSSTVCIGEMDRLLLRALPLGSALRLLPKVHRLKVDDVVGLITQAGFEIEHKWLPGSQSVVFLVARKPAR